MCTHVHATGWRGTWPSTQRPAALPKRAGRSLLRPPQRRAAAASAAASAEAARTLARRALARRPTAPNACGATSRQGTRARTPRPAACDERIRVRSFLNAFASSLVPRRVCASNVACWFGCAGAECPCALRAHTRLHLRPSSQAAEDGKWKSEMACTSAELVVGAEHSFRVLASTMAGTWLLVNRRRFHGTTNRRDAALARALTVLWQRLGRYEQPVAGVHRAGLPRRAVQGRVGWRRRGHGPADTKWRRRGSALGPAAMLRSPATRPTSPDWRPWRHDVPN